MRESIPVIFGVTGHRDLVAGDVERLRGVVRTLFEAYRRAYPSTQIILISALAEGADMLVAEVAVTLGIRLDVVLPYDEALYLDSFDDANAKEKFALLKAQATDIKTLPCDKAKEGSSPCYAKLGEYIANSSDILIALWDGVENEKKGGTAWVVSYARECFAENPSHKLEGNAIFVINTPRTSGTSAVEDAYKVQKEYLGSMDEGAFAQMCHKIDKLNKDLKSRPKEDEDSLTDYAKYFKKEAKKAQTRYKLLMIAILVLSFAGVASLEILHVFAADRFLWGYALSLLLAFGLYYYLKKSDLKNRFIHSRGIREALRVQLAWDRSGLDDDVSRYYFADHHHKFTWIRNILKNLNYTKQRQSTKTDPDYAQKEWIQQQIDYMKDAIRTREQKLHKYERYEKTLYLSGLVTLVVLFVWFVLEQFHILHHGILPFSWHHLVLFSTLLLAAAAFLGEKFLKIEAYEEDIHNFKIMKKLHESAQKKLKNHTPNDPKSHKIIQKLGIKALDENSKWVALHDSREVEFELE